MMVPRVADQPPRDAEIKREWSTILRERDLELGNTENRRAEESSWVLARDQNRPEEGGQHHQHDDDTHHDDEDLQHVEPLHLRELVERV